jgi:hypothetical protein
MSEIFTFDEAKHAKARKAFIFFGMVILLGVTLLSAVSSFVIYREGFQDMGPVASAALGVVAVTTVEGAFIWLVFGYTTVLSGMHERFFAFVGMWGLMATMLLNVVTHFMMVKQVPLHPFQQAWLSWGAVSIFIAVLVLVLMIKLADPVIQFVTLSLRYIGKEQETLLQAKREGLESEKVRAALAARTDQESEALVRRILSDHGQSK